MLGFLAGGKIKMAMYLGLALAVSAAIAYHYWTVNSFKDEIIGLNQDVYVLQADLEISKNNTIKLKGAVEDQKASIRNLETQRNTEVVANTVLRKQFKAARTDVNNLKRLLSRHDLNYLSLRKPGLIQLRINRGTKGVGTNIEELTQ